MDAKNSYHATTNQIDFYVYYFCLYDHAYVLLSKTSTHNKEQKEKKNTKPTKTQDTQLTYESTSDPFMIVN